MFKIVFEQKNGAGESIIVFKKGSHFVVNAVYQVKAVFFQVDDITIFFDLMIFKYFEFI